MTVPLSSIITRLSERKLRWFELMLVLTVPFWGYFCHSFYQLGTGYNQQRLQISVQMQSYEWTYSVVTQLGFLSLLHYVLQRRQRSFRDLGLSFGWRDWRDGFGLVLAEIVLLWAIYYGLWLLHFLPFVGEEIEIPIHNIEWIKGPVTLVAIAAMLVNPVFEEMLVRAFVQTELAALSGSRLFALGFSVLFQAGYHLYQGVGAAAIVGCLFLLYASYYAKTNRIWPVILAHCWTDLYALFTYGT